MINQTKAEQPRVEAKSYEAKSYEDATRADTKGFKQPGYNPQRRVIHPNSVRGKKRTLLFNPTNGAALLEWFGRVQNAFIDIEKWVKTNRAEHHKLMETPQGREHLIDREILPRLKKQQLNPRLLFLPLTYRKHRWLTVGTNSANRWQTKQQKWPPFFRVSKLEAGCEN